MHSSKVQAHSLHLVQMQQLSGPDVEVLWDAILLLVRLHLGIGHMCHVQLSARRVIQILVRP